MCTSLIINNKNNNIYLKVPTCMYINDYDYDYDI